MGQTSPLNRRWVIPVIVILVVLLALETSVIIIFVLESTYGGRSTFPGLVIRNVQPGCSTLTWSTQSTTITNQTLLFQCPGTGSASYALKSNSINTSGLFSETPYYQLYGTTPTFTLPIGYLSLSLTAGDCSYLNGRPSFVMIPLKTGEEVVVGGETYLYNYCAVIGSGVNHPASFTIDWSPGTPPTLRPAPFKLTASPTTATIPYGKTANYTITVTSLNGWTGNVTVSLRGGYTIEIPAQFNPPSVIVKAGASNSTTMMQPTYYTQYGYYAPRGTYTMVIDGDAACISMVMGYCMDQYNQVTLSIGIDIV